MSERTQLRWHDPAWQKDARDWIRAETVRNSIQLTGEIEQPHVYHWSTVMRVPSREGMIYFKATAEETIHEIALTEKLAKWFPEVVPELIAIDPRRGWMLMRDGGEQLRASIRPVKDVRPWEPVIRKYAELQIGLAEHLDEILALGVPDHRLAALPALYSQLLTDEESLRVGQEKGLTSEEFQQLESLKPRFAQICADLAAHGIPESINHGDFHDGNVLLKDGRITFFDWGDADVTHPFVSLRTWLVSMEIALELDDYVLTPEMADLLNCYLEAFEKFASKEDLRKAYALSKPVASVVKALAWQSSVARMDASVREEYVHIVPAVLQEFLYHVAKLTE
jgi:aminoglycoside/choline kinase family phosphotransferase